MAKRKDTQSESVIVEEVTGGSGSVSAQAFLEKNQNLILYVIGGLAVILLGWWLYKNMIVAPKQKEAIASMWQAEMQFGRDSFQLALENPGGGFDGFLALADKYSGTPAGNAAKYYAGVCYLHMGDFDNALKFLGDYDAPGDLLPAVKYGAMGDCYSEKQDFGKAADYYDKAVNATNNDVLAAYYLKKVGMLQEHQGNKDAALKTYERLRKDYPNQQSPDWRDIEKYIYRAGAGK